MVLNYRRIKVRNIAEAITMSKEQVGHILNHHLSMRRLSTRWMPCLLMSDQTRVRINICTALLAQLERNILEFWRRLIIVNETKI